MNTEQLQHNMKRISKWDSEAVWKYRNAQQVDVTDRLVREFITPTEKQAKIIADIKTKKPLPLDECDKLIEQGKL